MSVEKGREEKGKDRMQKGKRGEHILSGRNAKENALSIRRRQYVPLPTELIARCTLKCQFPNSCCLCSSTSEILEWDK
jgi:hypothetical protein